MEDRATELYGSALFPMSLCYKEKMKRTELETQKRSGGEAESVISIIITQGLMRKTMPLNCGLPAVLSYFIVDLMDETEL